MLGWGGFGIGDVGTERQVLIALGIMPKTAVEQIHPELSGGDVSSRLRAALTATEPSGGGGSSTPSARGRGRSKAIASKVSTTKMVTSIDMSAGLSWAAPGDVPPILPSKAKIAPGSSADQLLNELTERACSDLVAVRACVRATAQCTLKVIALVRGKKLHRLLYPYRDGIRAVLYDRPLHYLPPMARLGVLYSMLTCLRADPEQSIIPIDGRFMAKLREALDLI